MSKYEFKRAFYYEAERAVSEGKITFLLGPRKCGKTVCLKQLQDAFLSAVYVDAKRDFDTSSDAIRFMRGVISDIKDNKEVIYFIDEATYLHYPDKEIMSIGAALAEYQNTNTKIVFAGSQSRALEYWGHLAFAGSASFIRADFLTYPEWLSYKGLTEVSEQTYEDFLYGVHDFYSFTSTKEYLRGCLDETVMSNSKARAIIPENDCSLITDEMLLDVLYASLISLHDQVTYKTFVNRNGLYGDIEHFFADECDEIGESEVKNRIKEMLAPRYEALSKMNVQQYKQCLQFLDNCGLITITPVSKTFDLNPYTYQTLLSDGLDIANNEELFHSLNICIKYPMFYVDLMKGILQEKMSDRLPRELLGSIVECHVRGLLPSKGGFEYRMNDKEIDYVNNVYKTAVEITISNKRLRKVNFDLLPEGYKKTLLTNDQNQPVGDITRTPYYHFIFNNSTGKDLLAKKEPKRKQIGRGDE
jgi:hypothetical protein